VQSRESTYHHLGKVSSETVVRGGALVTVVHEVFVRAAIDASVELALIRPLDDTSQQPIPVFFFLYTLVVPHTDISSPFVDPE
jgi:hypothetical protein